MRVHVISDMEGVSGVVKWGQVTGGHPLYDEARRLYTEEINAAVRGAKSAGATEIVVMDCHGAGEDWTFNSLMPELLDVDCDWVVQDRWTSYTGFLESGCDAAILIGMHARAGTPTGVLNHTVSGSEWRHLWFNGTLVGEIGINAALCGHWGCPVLMVSGDDVTCSEGRSLLGSGLTTVAVKQGLSRFSARNISPERVRAMLEQGARDALADLSAVKPYDPGTPCVIEVEFMTSDVLDRFRGRPGVEIVEPLRLRSESHDWWSAWRQFFSD